MLRQITIESFKSLEKVQVDLGAVNVFVGANGGGKSNLLEAVGVLSAAASGRVDDEALIRRGVRPGLPSLYKCALPNARKSLHIVLSARSESASYTVSLFNPLRDPQPAWRYHTESVMRGADTVASRSHRSKVKLNPEAGLAALKAVELQPDDAALQILSLLRDYAIYDPNTPTLRGQSPELQPRDPVGLSGGGLPEALLSLLRAAKSDSMLRDRLRAFRGLIDWAKTAGSIQAAKLQLSPSAASSRQVVKFVDKYMVDKRNVLSGADASEGALYVLFAAVMALDPRVPRLVAIDNVDHGLNPRLAQVLTKQICRAILDTQIPRQLLLTSHNPQVLDGLPLKDDRVRLFTVGRSDSGRTVVKRVQLTAKLEEMAAAGWTLSRLWVMGHLGGVPNV